MGQNDHHNQRSGNSSGGSGSSRSSKKSKQKKVPQRGLGVAQLEKIRLEEQQKKDDSAVLQTVSLLSPTNSSCLAPNFRQVPSQSSISLPHPSPIDLSSSNSVVKNSSAIPNSDFLNQNSVPFSKPLNLGQDGCWTKVWNGEYSVEGENHMVDHSGFDYRPNMSLIYESTPFFPAPNGIQSTAQFQKQNPSSSKVKVSSGISSSSGINYNQMEPPSNQSFYGNIYRSKWPEEEKMIGMKRPYPFSLDNPPGPSFPCKFPPFLVHPIHRSGESASSANGGMVNGESNKPLLREGPSSFTAMPELNPEKVTEENGDLNGDFLTLALPKPAHPRQSRELPEVGPKSQENYEDPIQKPGPSIYSFFPSSKVLIGQATSSITSCSGEIAEKLDLNLKL